MKTVFQFVICLIIPLAIGGFSGYLTTPEITGEWFTQLIKPSFYPPAEVFPIVWTALYVLMGISLFMVVKQNASGLRTDAILSFVLQIILNFWWSIFFFRFKRPDVSLGEMAILWLAILFMLYCYRKVKPAAAWLQIPYLLWVSFALVLNYSLWS